MLFSHVPHEILFLLFLFEVQGIKFQVSGPQIVPDKKAEVVINCSHDDSAKPVMLWYQQRGSSGPLVLLGYNYAASTSNYEGSFKEQFEIKMEDAKTGTLVVREASVAHTAVYFCAASMADCVKFQPSANAIILNENARAEIKCEHDDSNLNVMLWYQQRPHSNVLSLICYNYVGSETTFEGEFKGRFEMTRENVMKGVLVRPRAEANDSGEYFCAASLAAGPVPIQPGELLLHPGINATLTCSLASDMASYTMLWYKQHFYGAQIEFIIKEHEKSEGRFQATMEEKQNRFSLKINKLQLQDSGTYYCAA
ncbi:unnamed protein product [Merluccius merluccius]